MLLIIDREKEADMVFCECGKEAVIVTSWTNRNPGRRFYGCPDQGSKCRFIGWVDKNPCQRCIDIIPSLLKAKNLVEDEKRKLQVELWELQVEWKSKTAEARKFKNILILSWIGFVLYVMCCC